MSPPSPTKVFGGESPGDPQGGDEFELGAIGLGDAGLSGFSGRSGLPILFLR